MRQIVPVLLHADMHLESPFLSHKQVELNHHRVRPKAWGEMLPGVGGGGGGGRERSRRRLMHTDHAVVLEAAGMGR